MDNKEFAHILEKRTLVFAVNIIRFSAKLPNTPEARVIKNQLTQSATSLVQIIVKQTARVALFTPIGHKSKNKQV